MNCADCNGPIGRNGGPPEGWQLNDGRTVCHACCVLDTGKAFDTLWQIAQWLTEIEEPDTILPAVGVEPQGNTTEHLIEHT